MGRLTKKQKFIKTLLSEIETDPTWSEFRNAIYKEYVISIKDHSPRWLYDSIIASANAYFDYMIANVDIHLQPEELVTDMGDVLESPITQKLIDDLKTKTIL